MPHYIGAACLPSSRQLVNLMPNGYRHLMAAWRQQHITAPNVIDSNSCNMAAARRKALQTRLLQPPRQPTMPYSPLSPSVPAVPALRPPIPVCLAPPQAWRTNYLSPGWCGGRCCRCQRGTAHTAAPAPTPRPHSGWFARYCRLPHPTPTTSPHHTPRLPVRTGTLQAAITAHRHLCDYAAAIGRTLFAHAARAALRALHLPSLTPSSWDEGC